jgi:peptidoglycan glycosyltransferase
VNRSIVGLFGCVLVLFGTLVGFTSWWTVVKGEELRENPLNRRALLAEERIKRGRITSADGRALARSVPLEGERYGRRYPPAGLFAHAIGYSYTSLGRAGLERSRNDELTGKRNELVGVIDSLLSQDAVGDDVVTTLDAGAQEAALSALGDRRGAVVALDVKTGGVLVMASNPTYDPNGLDRGDTFAQLNRDDSAPLVNRATQARYPPGSTMKVVTAAAALDSGKYTPASQVDGRNAKPISGVPLNNFGNQDFGTIDLTTALTNSVNTVWAEVGEKLGGRTMRDYMDRFGFYADPPLDYPDSQMTPSGVSKNGRLVRPTAGSVDVGRVAIGQGDLLATPMQMATVAQTIANGGVRLKPHLTAEVIDPDGRTLDEIAPEVAARVVSADTARALTAMMKNVVREGTGTAAALSGVEVAGKTGTAELNIEQRINQPWFIGFTDKVAVAVTLERITAGTGGTDAAPIAKSVLEALGQ